MRAFKWILSGLLSLLKLAFGLSRKQWINDYTCCMAESPDYNYFGSTNTTNGWGEEDALQHPAYHTDSGATGI